MGDFLAPVHAPRRQGDSQPPKDQARRQFCPSGGVPEALYGCAPYPEPGKVERVLAGWAWKQK
jgi:hypothetical protein